MSAVDFLDTNILVYAVDPSHQTKHTLARDLLSEASTLQTGVISYQVVQEGLNLLTGKFARVVKPADAQALLQQVWWPMMKVMPSSALFEKSLEIKERYRFSFYDSLIIAAALLAGCKRLLSEDLQHGQVIDGLKIVNPFYETQELSNR